jgi:hypothetical protein
MNWEKVYEEGYYKPDGSLYIEAAKRIEELEAETKELSMQYLLDTGQLGYYADHGAVLVPVFKKVKAVLGKGYK